VRSCAEGEAWRVLRFPGRPCKRTCAPATNPPTRSPASTARCSAPASDPTGSPAGLVERTCSTVAPWHCVPGFRRVCPYQQANITSVSIAISVPPKCPCSKVSSVGIDQQNRLTRFVECSPTLARSLRLRSIHARLDSAQANEHAQNAWGRSLRAPTVCYRNWIGCDEFRDSA